MFTVRSALSLGASEDRLRARDLDRSIRGVRMPVDATLTMRLDAAFLAVPSAFACGPTAAHIHGLPLPFRVAPGAGAIDIAIAGPGRAVRRRRFRARSLRVRPGDVVVVGRIPTLSVERAWCDLTRWCSVPELVAGADHAIRMRLTTLPRLVEAVDRLPDQRGTAKLRAALELVDPASESPKESETRALVVLAGLPTPRVNVTIHDERGLFVARVDQFFEDFGEVLEYQGDHHRTDQRQWRRDRTRESELESLGLHVTEVTEADLRRPVELVERVARNLARRGWRGEIRLSRWFPRTPPVALQRRSP
ncbi:hypothetical protein ET445_02890 [Agromyces protaetiae]|uniref:DUF559 domain-containing protein n=1 Tax=Agromyces protaetiae TaxID=2509455 RepID=A0A4P6FBZ6_9MICO|nr:hypothetical protein [Agromyces protaetiae]QAY72443.1 hypothetical protein ET445_02890 [Agromyces protaetiae]